MSTLVATEPIIRARLKKAHDKHYRTGVLGLRAEPVWEGSTFDYEGTPVTVVACPSVLAIWEAIVTRNDEEWTVVLTGIDDDDLGDTVLAHLLDGRLITPDPWDALRGNFAASTIEPALYRSKNDRAIANGLLSVLSAAGYTPAPSGVLTQDHAMSAVARDALKIVTNPTFEIDTLAVLEWSRSREAADGLAELQAAAGDELSAAFHSWLVSRAGRLARPMTALLASGRIGDLVPLGIVAGLFGEAHTAADKELGAFLGRYDLIGLTPDQLAAWYADARGLLTNSLSPEQQQSVLAAATAVVDGLKLGSAAASSELLPHGLAARLATLAESVTDALPDPLPADLDAPLITTGALQRIEQNWADVEGHFLAGRSPSCRAFTGAVRLARWLAEPLPDVTGLAATTEDYVRQGSWVDTALVTARRGAEDQTPAAALRAIIEAAATRRARRDRSFTAALADSPNPAVHTIENVLRDLVIPVAKQTPTLLLVIDALSVAAANDLVHATQRDGWTETSAMSDSRRAAALAVLPTLTQRSRCSLLCGELREGADGVERTGFLSVLREANLAATGGVPDPIFHKKALSAIPSGLALATDVNNAIADTANQRLVGVVLNYVDDTLHHTDPGGTDWNLDTITHLRPLLHAAKNAGRAVVITSDHGHLIEYGTSAKVDRANAYGQRAHGDLANVDPDREVLIEGPRVLTESKKVVLAVDADIRYGARNAGYHGGGSPAEAIVPVIVLLAGQLPEGAVPVVGAEPPWWYAGAAEVIVPVVVPKPGRGKRGQDGPGLFDETPVETANPLPDRVVTSATFAAQFSLAGRIVVKRPQIKALLVALIAAGTHELTLAQAAAALSVATASANGALMQTKRVLDVEGYEVLRVAGGVVRLDVAALKEQFGVSE